MKYYVVQETWDTKTGELLTQERVTGDTEDIAWAQKQLDFLFNERLKEERDFIGFGTVAASKTKCSFLNEKTKIRFVAYIRSVPSKTTFTAAETILALNNYYAGDWSKVFEALSRHEDIQEDWLSLNNSSFITKLDVDYPVSLKESAHPPFVIYYKGDIKLLSSESSKMAVDCKRDAEEKLLLTFERDVQELPQDVIIVTSYARIAEYALAGPFSHKVIFVKPCGMNKYLPSVVTAEIEKHIIDKGGLVCTCFPDNTEAQMYTCLRKTEIMAGIANALLVVDISQRSSGVPLISYFAGTNKNVMVYPTFPEHQSFNNCLIKEGAYLVENAEDIKTFLNLKED